MDGSIQAKTGARTTLRGLGTPVRLLFTLYLLTIGLGYLFALSYLFLVDIEPHRRLGLDLVQGTIIKYYGKRGETRLEAAIKGSMGENISQGERQSIIDWVRAGAREDQFGLVQPIFSEHCVFCHSPESGLAVSPLTTYDEVSEYVAIDLGQSFKALTRVSHIHLFGISFIFFLTGIIFSYSEMNRAWVMILICVPFLAIWIDILSWWFTKYQPVFAYTVIIGGVLMGGALAAQIFISIYEMWFKRIR